MKHQFQTISVFLLHRQTSFMHGLAFPLWNTPLSNELGIFPITPRLHQVPHLHTNILLFFFFLNVNYTFSYTFPLLFRYHSFLLIGCFAMGELWLFRDFLFLAAHEVVGHLVVLKHETRLALFFVFDLFASVSFFSAFSSCSFSWCNDVTRRHHSLIIRSIFFLIWTTLVWFGGIISGQDPIGMWLKDSPTIHFSVRGCTVAWWLML